MKYTSLTKVFNRIRLGTPEKANKRRLHLVLGRQHKSATIFKIARRCMQHMTSQLQIFRARSILWAFVVPKLTYSFTTAGWSAQPYSINFELDINMKQNLGKLEFFFPARQKASYSNVTCCAEDNCNTAPGFEPTTGVNFAAAFLITFYQIFWMPAN